MDTANPNGSVYTVMVDDGLGEFLWRKQASDTEASVGANVYSYGMDRWHPDCLMSRELFDAFCDWVKSYMDALPPGYSYQRDTRLNLDWDWFNAQGQRLARRLQEELGSSVTVRYVRAWNDPE